MEGKRPVRRLVAKASGRMVACSGGGDGEPED